MKKCTYCGKTYPEQTQVCPVDGYSLESDQPPPIRDPSLPPPLPELGFFDNQFLRTPRWACIFAGTCIALPMLIFCLLGMAFCSDSKARDNARFGAAVSFIMMIVALWFRWYANRIMAEMR